jgi:hypothetical protein
VIRPGHRGHHLDLVSRHLAVLQHYVQPPFLIEDDAAAIRVVHLEQHARFGHRCGKAPTAVIPPAPPGWNRIEGSPTTQGEVTMRSILRRRPSTSIIISCFALFMALGGV